MSYPILTGLILELLRISKSGDLGKAIENKIEQVEREPDETKRAELHKEALAMEKELAAQTPEPPPIAAATSTDWPVTELSWQQIVCSAGTARMCFGQTIGALCGHGVKLATARRHCDYLAKWFAAKPPVSDDDKRTFAAYEFAETFTKRREGGELPAAASTSAEEKKEEPVLEEEKEEIKTLNWKLVMVPFNVNFKAPAVPIKEGDKLGDLTPVQIKFLHVNRILKPDAFPLKSKAELMFKAGMYLAVQELKIA